MTKISPDIMRIAEELADDYFTVRPELRTKMRLIRLLAAALAAEMNRAEWQPISSAPLDGTNILAYWAKSDWFGVAYYANNSWEDYEDKCWISEPTHWMPLPQSPKDTP